MKRKLLILSVLVICIATLAAGTLAYFTSEGTAHNVITTGGVDIAVQEWADEDKTQPFQDPTGVMPGTTVTKIAEVKNTGAADAWVRVQVTQSIQRDKELYPNDGLVTLDCNTTDWTQGEDGYFYYNKVLKPGEVTEPIFTNVAFSGTMHIRVPRSWWTWPPKPYRPPTMAAPSPTPRAGPMRKEGER